MRNAGPDGRYLTGDEPPAFPKQLARNAAIKLSYQMTPKYQLSGYTTRDKNFNEADLQIAPFGAAVDFAHSPWEQTNPFDWKPYVYKTEFRGTPSNTTFFDVQYGKSGYKLFAMNVSPHHQKIFKIVEMSRFMPTIEERDLAAYR